ncbi:substrate-binding domain-containing protein [Arthrobacter sp. 2MCAF14]|uniref:LacI family DNA-binding transcriptional regulator n=1 Tax=Arthrobacter sp. 2MCAF14 TaxID=3232982 RepID=UPI003F904847
MEAARVLTEDRKNQILRELALRGSLNAAEFARRMGISGMTVRRDLASLDGQGLLQRVHGGAVAVTGPPRGPAGQLHGNTGGPAGEPGPPTLAGSGTRPPARQHPLATIGMIVPTARYYFPGIIRGAETAAQELGVRLVLGVSNYSPAEEQRQIQRLLKSGVDGLLVTPSGETLANTPTLDLLASAEVPVIVVERSIDDVMDDGSLESVRSDHVRGAEIAVNHLLALGHRKIALCVRESSPTASRLLEGYRSALQKAGITHDPALTWTITTDTSDPEALRQEVDSIVDGFAAAGATAGIVHNDEDALMFAGLCEARGLRIPADLAVVAYDDEIASFGTVPLSAIAPPKFDVGYHAVQMCLNRLGPRRGSRLALQRVSLSPALVIRGSTAS